MLHIESIQKYFNETCVLSNVSFVLKKGDIGCLLGASGCGKTTLLRIIAGFEKVGGGQLSLDGNVVSSNHKHLAPEDRNIGMVFQDYALFPHLTVRENIAFGLPKKKGILFSKKLTAAQEERIDEMLKLVGLSNNADAYPHELSGGQQQRIALARALAPKPKLLLMDEPFSNLDITLRERLSVEMRAIIKQEGITALMVTHNQSEAFAMGDVIGIMSDGVLHQWDTPIQVYQHPATEFTASFIGEGSLIGGTLSGTTVQTALGDYPIADMTFFTDAEKKVSILIRPEQLHINSPVSASNQFPSGKIEQILFRGAHQHCTVRLTSNETVTINCPLHDQLTIGQQVHLSYSS